MLNLVSIYNTFFPQVQKSYRDMPFNLRLFEDEKKARMGVLECVSHKLIDPYPVLWERVSLLHCYHFKNVLWRKRCQNNGLGFARCGYIDVRDHMVCDPILLHGKENLNHYKIVYIPYICFVFFCWNIYFKNRSCENPECFQATVIVYIVFCVTELYFVLSIFFSLSERRICCTVQVYCTFNARWTTQDYRIAIWSWIVWIPTQDWRSWTEGMDGGLIWFNLLFLLYHLR